MVYPESLAIKDKSAYETQFQYYFLIANIFNQMDIKLTFFLLTSVYMSGQILLLKQQAKLEYLKNSNCSS